MSLELFLASLLSISLVTTLSYFLFNRKSELTPDRALRNFTKIHPTENISDIVISECGSVAILSTDKKSALGLVTRFGDRVVCRLLQHGDGTIIELAGPFATIRLDDFTMPRLEFLIPEGDTERLAGWFKPFLANTPSAPEGGDLAH